MDSNVRKSGSQNHPGGGRSGDSSHRDGNSGSSRSGNRNRNRNRSRNRSRNRGNQAAQGEARNRPGSSKSRGNRSRSQRQNKSGGQNRNRSKNRNRNRNRGSNRGRSQDQGRSRRDRGQDSRRSRGKAAPKPTLLQKFLSAITFGLLGKPGTAKKTRAKVPRTRRRNSPPPPPSAAVPPPRKKPPVDPNDVPSPWLHVDNLDYEANENDLEELFRGAGAVRSAEVLTDERTQQSKGEAFVEMNTIDEAIRAIEILHDEDFRGRRLVIRGAKDRDEK